ncbi:MULTISPECIES: tape measure protein [unclassified Chelatococcus]|uniref:tape measure protein n=1 Tax=unclassified Chelatococcus TaxID=2638111 RepID=UPI001BCD03B3|nr:MULTISPECIES: tape measure protein [unclassified Chelatococcus]MBS7696273.1 DUF4214 domain-containing protein [Chelatococcus sp. YT9]MBX3560052.1 DUF4214 domain-containing protein [Chelatococcus sp.]
MDLASAKVVRLVETRYTSEGAEKAIGDAQRLDASQGKVGRSAEAVAVSTDKSTKSVLSADDAYKKLLASVDKQFRAQSQLAAGQAKLDRAMQQGVIEAREHARVMDLLRQRYTVLNVANDNYSGAVGGLGTSLAGLAARLGVAGAAFAAVATATAAAFAVISPGKVIEVTREFETLQASLRTVTGSADNAKAAFASINEFAVQTPFSVQQVTEAFIRLKSLGLDAGAEALTSYGNTASAMGKPVMQMIEAVADAVTGEFERLKEFGIRASKDGEQVAFTFQGVTTTVKKSADDIAKYLQGIGNAQFAGAMAEQMKTLEGSFSNLEDMVQAFQRRIGEGDFSQSIKDLNSAISDLLGNNMDVAETIGGAFAAVTKELIPLVDGVQVVINAFRDLASWGQVIDENLNLSGIAQQFADMQQASADAGASVREWLVDAFAAILPVAVGTVQAIVAAFDTMHGAMQALGARIKNAFLSIMEDMINGVIDRINALTGSLAAIGVQIGQIGKVSFGKFEVDAAASFSNIGTAAREAYEKGAAGATELANTISQRQQELKGESILKGMAANVASTSGALPGLTKNMNAAAGAANNLGAATKKAAGGAKEAASAYENLVQRTRDRIEELELERRYVGQTTDAVIKLKLAHDLERAAKKSGIEVTAEMRREWSSLGDDLAGATRRLDDAREAMRDLQESQRYTGDLFADFITDMKDGAGSLSDAFKNLGDVFFNSGLQALLTGEGPLGGVLGLSATEKGQQGGLLGLLAGNDVKLFRETISKGVEDGFTKPLKTMAQGGYGPDMQSTGMFGIDGKALMGGITALASLGAAYGGGMSAGSPMMGAATGALSGGIGALSLAAIPALSAIPMIGPILAIGGALLGGGLGFLGGSQSQKQRKEELQRQAEENYQAAKPQVAQLGQLFRGDELGNIQQQIQAGIDKLNELGPVLVNAGHVDELIALQNDYNTFVNRMKDEFRADFTGTIDELRAGLGAQGPFKQASDAVKQFGDSAKSFVADTATAFGEGAWQIQNARDASIDYALSMLDQAKTLTEVQQSIQSINGTAAGLSKVLQDLGMSAEDAANAINQRVGAAMDRLRSAFTEGLERRLNEASDMGYLNEMADQIAQYRNDLADAAALGLDGALAARVFAAEAQQIVNGAELAGDAFNALVQQFPELAGVVKEFSQALADMGNDLAAIAQRQQSYYDRIFNAANDNSTLEGALKAFDRNAQREREAEMKAGGQAITDLELALAAERVKIVNDFAAKAKAAEQQAAEQAARAAQQKVDEAQRAVDDARSDLQRAYEQQASTINATISRLEAFTSSIRKLRADLRFDDSLSPYNDRQQQQEAQATFQELAAKAMAGDQTAMDQLADAARRYLEESKAYYGFNEVYARIFEEVQSTLEAVGSKSQSELDIARAQLSALDAQVSGLLTVNDSVLTVAAGIEKLNAAVAALAAAQAAQIGNGTGTPDQRTAYVTSLYQKYFGRQPDQAGLDFWVKSDLSTSQLDQAFADAKAAGAMRLGGIVGAYARGGLVGNGIWDMDSVIARYAGGGNIALAGGEHVTRAPSVNPATYPVLDYINRTGRAPANDDSAKEEIRALRALVEQLIGVSVQGHKAVAQAVVENTSAVKEDTRKASTAQIARRTGTNG